MKITVAGLCCDMNEGYINAALEGLKNKVPVIIDRFHVANKYRECFVQLRKSELIRLRKKLSDKQYRNLKSAIAILRRNAELVSKEERKELEKLFRYSPKLRTGYRLCRRLTDIYNSEIGRRRATNKINAWIVEVEKSKLTQFDTIVSTHQKYKNRIVQYFNGRHTSGFVEGFNNKIKVIKRRCCGMFDENSLFRRLFLDTEGYNKYLPKLTMACV